MDENEKAKVRDLHKDDPESAEKVIAMREREEAGMSGLMDRARELVGMPDATHEEAFAEFNRRHAAGEWSEADMDYVNGTTPPASAAAANLPEGSNIDALGDDEVRQMLERGGDEGSDHDYNDFGGALDPFPLSTVTVTDKDGDKHHYKDAAIVGIWSGHLVVSEVSEELGEPYINALGTKTQRGTTTVKTHYINLTDVERAEHGGRELDEPSATRWQLEGPGLLGEDDELDMSQGEDTDEAQGIVESDGKGHQLNGPGRNQVNGGGGHQLR